MKQRIILLLLTMTCLTRLSAAPEETSDLLRLQADMLRLISTSDKEGFMKVTEQLKAESHRQGNERLFYTAWGNQAAYEATHQNYPKADEITEDITNYAEDQNSFWGHYVALHTKAVNLLQKQDYDAAEAAFLEAVGFRHKYFPNESAGDDLQELMKIANHRKDQPAGLKYARQILAEPNVAPIHKGRALYRLSQFAFNKNDKLLFDSIYNELTLLRKSDGIGTVEPVVEVNYNIINGNYQEALRLCHDLSPELQAERMAVIYHRMGDDKKAYEYMSRFKRINDSIVLVSHGNVVASCYVQMNNERMKLEQQLLEEESTKWLHLFTYTLIAAILVILALVIWQHRQRIRHLENENEQLEKARKNAEKAFDMKNEFINNIANNLREPINPIQGFSDILGTKDYELQPEERLQLSQMIKDSSRTITRLIDEMAELSLYESKKSLPVNYDLSPNHICRYMVDSMRPLCKQGVRMYFESELPEDYVVKTNEEAVKALLKHLIDNALQYTDGGVITVACTEYDDNVRISVTDTGKGISMERWGDFFESSNEPVDSQKLEGVGLSICKAIIKLLRGKIWLDKKYTDGTRFVFELPIHK